MKIDLSKIVGVDNNKNYEKKTLRLLEELERQYGIDKSLLNEKNILSFVANTYYYKDIVNTLIWIKKNKVFDSKNHQKRYVIKVLENKKEKVIGS